MAISIKTPKEIQSMRAANQIVAATLDHLHSIIQPGISLLEIDKICEDMIRAAGAKPAFKGLYGFPNAACISVNEVVIHGIPNGYILQDGDIVSVDIGSNLNGFFGDSARTYPVGNISKSDEELIACSKDALYYAIDEIRAGMHFKELCYKLEQFILGRGYVPLKGFCGHGIGRTLYPRQSARQSPAQCCGLSAEQRSSSRLHPLRLLPSRVSRSGPMPLPRQQNLPTRHPR